MRFAVLALLAALALRCAAAQTSTAARTAAAHAEARSGAAAVVTGESRSGRSGLTYVWLRPAVDGVEVADDPALVVLDDAGAVVHTRGEIAGGAVESATDALGPDAAVERAAAATGTAARGVSGAEPSARRVFVRTATGALRLAYAVALYPADASRWSVVQIDAATGAVLSERRLAIFEHADGAVPFHSDARPEAPLIPFIETLPSVLLPDGASYRVVAPPNRSPLDGGRALVTTPADALASPFGWHDTDGAVGAEFTTTRGNNAHAFLDRDANGLPDAAGAPDGGAALAFDFALDEAAGPEASREAGVTNAFFWVSHAHDVFYHYGFDEAGGNFQTNAYGRAGGNSRPDPVQVLVQNGSATDNAFMTVPPDGLPPTLYLLESTRTAPRRDYALDAEVVVHEITHGLTARLTGGPGTSECLGVGDEDMAEGWSDWVALMLTMRAGETRADARRYGAYTGGPDVRIAPYSADFSVNSLTYGSTVGMTARHAIGTVWATALWELTWDLIDAHGFSATLSDARGVAGNQIALSLVTEALRLQPCRPGFVDGRNAILLADAMLYGGAHYALLQTAFARRGLGRGARQGTSAINTDNVESFAVETGPADAIPPAPVSDLVAAPLNETRILLTFRATGDDGLSGQATAYDIRYRRSPIVTDVDFATATPVTDLPPPRESGETETVTLTGLLRGTRYYVAVRAYDDVNNPSALATAAATTIGGSAPPPQPPPPQPTVPTIQIDANQVSVSVPERAEGQVNVVVRNVGTFPTRVYGSVVGWVEGGTLDFMRSNRSTRQPAARTPSIAAPETAITGWTPAAPGRNPRDDGYADVALPFAFAFGDDRFNHVRVSTDGYLAFVPGDVSADAPRILGSVALPNGIVAPYWTDLRPDINGNVYAGALPDGRFAVEYDRMSVVLRADEPPVSFRVLLSASGAITFEYGRTRPEAPGVIRGVEDLDGVRAYAFQARAADSTLALLVPPSAAMALTADDLTINAGQERPFTVIMRAADLEPGQYTGFFSATNRTDQAAVRVLVLLDVTARPADGPEGGPPGSPPVEPPDPPGDVPPTVTLRAARPNPVRGRTAVTVGLPAALPVRLAVYDARGREVAVLAEGTFEAGLHDAVWDASAAAPGLYAVRLVAGREARTATVVVVR